MSKYKFGSIVNRDFRNTLQRLADDASAQGKAIQDLVAEGQLTPEQYATLIQVVNGLISKGDVSVHDIDKGLGKLDATFFTASFLDQLNGGVINATKVLPESITTEELAKGAVIPEKTDFFNTSSNLFNKNNITIGRTIETDGTEVDSTVFWMSNDFIPLEKGETLSFSDDLGYNISNRIITYNADKQFFSRSGTTNGKYTNNSSVIKFIRISSTAHPDDLMVNRGETLLPYEEYYHAIHNNFIPSVNLEDKTVTPKKTTFFNISDNLFNIENVLPDRSIDTEGNIVSDSIRWFNTDYIPVRYGDTVYIHSNDEGIFRVAQYFSDKTFHTRNSTVNQAIEITTTNVRFIRISGENSFDENTVMVTINQKLPFQPYGKEKINEQYLPTNIQIDLEEKSVTPNKTTFFNKSNNLFNIENVLSERSVDTEGNIVSDDIRWFNTDYIPVKQGDTVYIHSNDEGVFRVALYYSDKTFRTRSGTFNQMIEITGSSDSFIRISGENRFDVNAVMVTLNQKEPFQPYGEEKIDEQFLPTDIQIDLEEVKEELEQTVLNNIGGLNPYPPRLSLTKIHEGSSVPLTMSEDGQTIYGRTGSTSLVLSNDEWETFETITTTPRHINMVRELDDGELIISCNRIESLDLKAKVYKTQGFDRLNPNNTEIIEVLETGSTLANITNNWGISTYNEIVVLSEYGLHGVDGANYVYYSDDYGNTFTEIFDLKNANVEGMPPWSNNAHLHTVCYDPYYNRIWLCTGDGSNTAVYYTDDRVNWHFVEGSNVVQYTGIIALEDAVVFGSDRNPNGLHIYRRKQKGEKPKIVTWYKLNDHPSLTHVFGLPYRRAHEKNVPVYFPAQTTGTNGTSVVMGFADSKKAHLLYETDAVHSFGDGAGVNLVLGDTAQGNVLVSVAEPDGKRVVYKADSPTWE